jgi:ligand-binding sensor domain-containing protein/signal transduction histidine kinase
MLPDGRALTAFVLRLICLSLWAFVARVEAEQLPARTYTTRDGLAGNVIMHLYVDSRQFLWISTRDGLSRFDGVRFTTYDMTDGLPTAMVNRIFETRAGTYWVATNSGACRFNPRGRRPASALAGPEDGRPPSETPPSSDEPLFVQYRVGSNSLTNRVNFFHEDRSGRLWAGTDGGLFCLEPAGGRDEFRPVTLPLVPADHSAGAVHTAVEDDEGNLWFGADWGLTRLLPDRRAVMYRIQRSGESAVTALMTADAKRLWVGHSGGLIVLEPEAASTFAGSVHPHERRLVPPTAVAASSRVESRARPAPVIDWFTAASGLAPGSVISLHRGTGGSNWVGTLRGLSHLDTRGFQTYTTANGLADNRINAMASDRAGNLWVGTQTGLTKLTRGGLVTYGTADGLGPGQVHALAEDESGRLVAVTGDHRVNRFDGTRFKSIRPNLPANATAIWNSPFGFLSRAGDWWMLTTTGLYRFARTARFEAIGVQRPSAVYTSQRGLPDDSVARVFEDASGDLWVSTTPGGILRWRRSTDVWHTYSEADGLPPLRQFLNWATAFVQDGETIWIGFYEGGLARFRDGRFQWFTREHGLPPGMVTALHIDKTGRLWIGTALAGLSRVDDPAVDRPTFAPVRSVAGLAINVRCLSEDAWGQIYAGTSRGIYRIDPSSGAVKHFTSDEGLASDFVTAAFRDRHGTMWFGTFNGISRLQPALEPRAIASERPVEVVIAAVRVGGIPLRLSELGEAEPPAVTLGPNQNHIDIDFFGLSFEPGDALKYQYRLEGATDDWSPATDIRSVSYARLSPGSYRFSVRGIRSDGLTGPKPAVFSFTVLPPVYARWWFLTASAGALALLAYAAHRARLARAVYAEQLRSRIATDLHDDLGASLSQIAVSSEVLRRRRGAGMTAEEADGVLERIGTTARGLVSSMNDIVWAVNPRQDSLADLVARMRRFAEDMFAQSDTEFEFLAPADGDQVRIGPAAKREILLILKESVTNIVKHAHCKRAGVALGWRGRQLTLRVWDDGRGFDPAAVHQGNGLRNLRTRVAALDGRLAIVSAPGHGTEVTLAADLR